MREGEIKGDEGLTRALGLRMVVDGGWGLEFEFEDVVLNWMWRD